MSRPYNYFITLAEQLIPGKELYSLYERCNSYYFHYLRPLSHVSDDSKPLSLQIHLLKKYYGPQLFLGQGEPHLDISYIDKVNNYIFSKDKWPAGFIFLNNFFPYYPKEIRGCFDLKKPVEYFKKTRGSYLTIVNKFLLEDFSGELQPKSKLAKILLLSTMMSWASHPDILELDLLDNVLDILLKFDNIVDLNLFLEKEIDCFLQEETDDILWILPAPFNYLNQLNINFSIDHKTTIEQMEKIKQAIVNRYRFSLGHFTMKFFIEELVNFLITVIQFVNEIPTIKDGYNIIKKISLIKEKQILLQLKSILCKHIQSAEELLNNKNKKSLLDQASLEKINADQNEAKRVLGRLTEKFPLSLNEICNKMNEVAISVEKSQTDLVLLESKEKKEQKKIKNTNIAQKNINRGSALQKIFSDKQSKLLKKQEENSIVKRDHEKNISVLDKAQQKINKELENCSNPIEQEEKIIREIFKWFTIEKTINIHNLEKLSELIKDLNTPRTNDIGSYDLDTIHTILLQMIALSDIYLNNIKQQIKIFRTSYLPAIYDIKDRFGQPFNGKQHCANDKINRGLPEIVKLIENANESCRKLLAVFDMLNQLIIFMSGFKFSRAFIEAWDNNIIRFRSGEFQDFQ